VAEPHLVKGQQHRGVLHDLHEPNASRRFKAFGSFASFDGFDIGESKVGIISSADGRAWHSYLPVDEMRVSADTANQLVYDPHLGRYLAFSRNWCHTYTRPPCGAREFGFRRAFRSDAAAVEGPWSVAVEVAHGEEGYELYSLAPWRHPDWAAGTYLAIGSFYDTVDRVYCELLSSADYGGNWTRLAPHRPFIPLGPNGTLDSHTCYAAPPIADPTNSTRTRFYCAARRDSQTPRRA
jgi:hypothetical protein